MQRRFRILSVIAVVYAVLNIAASLSCVWLGFPAIFAFFGMDVSAQVVESGVDLALYQSVAIMGIYGFVAGIFQLIVGIMAARRMAAVRISAFRILDFVVIGLIGVNILLIILSGSIDVATLVLDAALLGLFGMLLHDAQAMADIS